MREENNYQKMMEQILGERERPEIEPVPGKPGEFREIKKSDKKVGIKTKTAPVDNITDNKQTIFEKDAIENERLEKAIEKVVFKGGEGEEHPYYDLKAKPFEQPSAESAKENEIEKRKKKVIPDDTLELKFK
jgi:hypothetical protein